MPAVEDILNSALRRVGYPTPIGQIMEGSRAARVALDFYAQTRDALFSEFDWSFARQAVSLGNPIKTAPVGGYGANPWNPATNPPPPWIFEYAYPDNCINVRSVRPVPILIPEPMPRVNIFAQAFDNLLGQKVVLTNLANAQAVITARVTDPNEWQDNDFIEALIDRLALLFTKNLGGDANAVQIAEHESTAAGNIAATLP